MRRHYVLAGVVGFLCLWVIGVALVSFLADGWFYKVEQPVPIVAARDGEVVLFFRRYARWDMDADCANEIVCEFIHTVGHNSCPLEKGWREFKFSLPLPKATNGPCIARGTVAYSPLGPLGPTMQYLWESETFAVCQD